MHCFETLTVRRVVPSFLISPFRRYALPFEIFLLEMLSLHLNLLIVILSTLSQRHFYDNLLCNTVALFCHLRFDYFSRAIEVIDEYARIENNQILKDIQKKMIKCDIIHLLRNGKWKNSAGYFEFC